MTEPSQHQEDQPGQGILVLIVGQSGVGKDTLLNGARAHLLENSNVVFVERTITRPLEPTERHHPCTPREFSQIRDSGGFAFWWEAHGLSYGVPKTLEALLTAGRLVVCNASRTVITLARARYGSTVVIEIAAGRSQRLQRLAARGRENAADIQERVDRHVPRSGTSTSDIVIENNTTPEMGIHALVEALETLGSRVKR